MRRFAILLALLASIPSPLVGEGQEGGIGQPPARSQSATPHPGLPPQGGTESTLIDADAAAILAAVRAPGAKVTLVNMWATWCIPCREEFPDLMRLRADYAARGLRLLFVSGDFDSERAQVETFLREQKVDFPTYSKTGPDMPFIDGIDPAWNGALPATFVYDAAGARRQSIFGKTTYGALERAISALLEPGSKN